MSDSPNKATLRRKTRSALKHRAAADALLNAIADSTAQLNAALDKLDADTAGALDTDYNTLKIASLFEADEPKRPGPHASTLRRTLRSAMAHRRLADEIADSIEEWQAAFNLWMDKLDAEAGVLNDIDYESLLAVDTVDADGEGEDAQHRAPLRKSLISAMANKRAANQIMDALIAAQDAMRSSLAALDAGSVAGAHAGFKVDVFDPDAK